MKETFQEAIYQLFQFEGWGSNDLHDAGGDTILGISKRWWPIEHDEIARITSNKGALDYATAFYRKHFWDAFDCDNLPHPLDAIVFDSAVNPGPSWTKHTLAITQDWKEFLELRRQHYRVVANPVFLKGLLARCDTLEKKYTSG